MDVVYLVDIDGVALIVDDVEEELLLVRAVLGSAHDQCEDEFGLGGVFLHKNIVLFHYCVEEHGGALFMGPLLLLGEEVAEEWPVKDV